MLCRTPCQCPHVILIQKMSGIMLQHSDASQINPASPIAGSHIVHVAFPWVSRACRPRVPLLSCCAYYHQPPPCSNGTTPCQPRDQHVRPQVIFLDSDNVAVGNPGDLLEAPEYMETGALLWPDYWASTAAPDLAAILEIPGVIPGSFESGQMVFDKRR